MFKIAAAGKIYFTIVMVGETDTEHYSFYNTPLFNITPTSPWNGNLPTRDYFQYDIQDTSFTTQ